MQLFKSLFIFGIVDKNFYSEHYVSPKSEVFVKKLWVLDNHLGNQVIANQLVLPNGCFNLAIVSGQGLEVFINRSCFKLQAGLHFCSQMTNSVLVNIYPHTKVIIIQLHAWTPSFLITRNMQRFVDSIIEIPDLYLPLKYQLPIKDYHHTDHILQLVEHNITDDPRFHTTETLIKLICERIQEVSGNITVEELVKYTGYSIRLLQTKFRQAVGLNLKTYIKIIKFRNTIDAMVYSSSPQTSLTEIALAHHYYDQSHFIKTFKKIAKVTPKKFDADYYLLSYKK